jgi:hypothetical protein
MRSKRQASHLASTDGQQTKREIRDQAEGTVNKTEKTNGEKQPPINYGKSDSADLYCSKAVRSHGDILGFGVEIFPVCEQGLHPPKPNGRKDYLEEYKEAGKTEDGLFDQPRSKGYDKEAVFGTEKSEEEVVVAEHTPDITYEIQYKNSADYTISTEPWGKSFDLETARGRGLTQESQTACLRNHDGTSHEHPESSLETQLRSRRDPE